MSAIAGIGRLDGAPVDRATIDRMAARLGPRAPDGTSIVCTGSAGLVFGRLSVTPESDEERQPLADAASGLIIVFDGRLDNRQELLDALAPDPRAGDAALTLRAYQAWGDAAAERLLGDFAFAIWDGARRRLVCGRDTSGIRTLFYRRGEGWIAWASEIDVLAACIDPMPPPNEGMAAEYLTGLITDKRETLFRDIFRVPPAHALIASARGVDTRCYWTPDPRRVIRYARDGEYADHLSDLLRTAVAARLRTRRPAGVMLSGGVDSSSVAGLAAELCREHRVPCAGIETFSISVPGPGDERPFFEMVTDKWRLPAHRLMAALPRPGQFREEIARDLEVQMFPHAPTVDPMRALVRDRGARVLLTGMGGDDWLGTSPSIYADLLEGGRLGALRRRALSERHSDDFSGWPAIARSAVWPLVPPPLQRVVRLALRRGRPPAWITPAFAERAELADRLARHRAAIDFPSHEQDDIWHEGTSGMMVYSLETASRSVSRFGIEHAHPYHDRRIVEFGMALPSEQRWRDGRSKDLLRRAMAPYLPPAVAARLTNPNADHALVQAVDAEAGPHPFDNLPTERLGWTRGSEVRAMYARMRTLYQSGTPGFGSLAWTLWGILAMNLWLDAANVVQYRVTATQEGIQRV